MTRSAPGSVVIHYDGLQAVVMKQIRGQCRQFVKQAITRGWCERQDDNDLRPTYRSTVERDWVGDHTNGAWWTRSWTDSLTPERGGAPETVVYTYGHEIRWRRGPIQVSNTFKLRFDYVGLFELNPDPVELDDQLRRTHASIDVSPDSDIRIGTTLLFKIRPRIRLGIPKDSKWDESVKSMSAQVSFDVIHWGRTIIRGELQASWKSSSDIEVSFDMTMVSW